MRTLKTLVLLALMILSLIGVDKLQLPMALPDQATPMAGGR